jgi:hypothetical protein
MERVIAGAVHWLDRAYQVTRKSIVTLRLYPVLKV